MKHAGEYTIHFPEVDTVDQGEEYIFLEKNGTIEKITFHDYDRIYAVPGLYEYLFYDRYKCNSPEVVCGLLEKHLHVEAENPDPLFALDVGAGNGMVGERLSSIGASTIIGVDIIEEAEKAVRRDRPDVYDEYHVADLTDLTPQVRSSLEKYPFNCMTVVAALGFGDIPPEAFVGGFDMVNQDGWLAFNIKEDFVGEEDKTGFCCLIERLEDNGVLDIKERHRYRHRYCQDGESLYYYAVVGRKRSEIELDMLEGLSS